MSGMIVRGADTIVCICQRRMAHVACQHRQRNLGNFELQSELRLAEIATYTSQTRNRQKQESFSRARSLCRMCFFFADSYRASAIQIQDEFLHSVVCDDQHHAGKPR